MNLDEPLMTLREVLKATGLGRSTLYEYESSGRFPKRASPPKTRARWYTRDVRAWIGERSQPNEDAADAERRKLRFAHAPRRNGRRRYDPNRLLADRIVNPYAASPLDAAREAALRKKLGLNEEERCHETVKPIRWSL
jgi:predicted DNA-binding transcriptional regulator AlpA